MYLKTLSVAAGITVIVTGAMSVSSAALAETPACGDQCVTIYNDKIGPGFPLDLKNQASQLNQPIVLSPASTTNPAEDFSINTEGTVDEFYNAGLVSADLDTHYGNDQAFELGYEPTGVQSGYCAGTATAAGKHTRVSLQPCTVSSRTVWVIANSSGYESAEAALASGYSPLINGSDTDFTRPYVLTYPRSSYPTGRAQPALNTSQEASAGTANSKQLWSDAQEG
jgi:hypothetical protein